MPDIKFEGFAPEVSFQGEAQARSKSVKVKSCKAKKGKAVKSHKRSSPKK